MEPELRSSLVSGSIYSCSKFSDETTSDTKFTHSVYSCSRFSDDAKVDIPFTTDLESFKIDVDLLTSVRGRTYIDEGLRAAEKEFQEHALPGIPKVNGF